MATYRLIDGKIEVTTEVVKAYSIKKLRELKTEAIAKKDYLSTKRDEANSEIAEIQILIDKYQELNV